MNHQTTDTRLTDKEIDTLKNRAIDTLDKLVTKQGIYASPKQGWSGEFHAWFGRDTAITADLIFSSQHYDNNSELTDRAYQALISLTQWQGKNHNQATGEEKGKITHEIRKASSFTKVDLVQHGRGTNTKSWYIDPKDGLLKNWDSCDSTPLWIISVARWHQLTKSEYSTEILTSLRSALDWCLYNLKVYKGLAGFKGADLQPHRLYSGLHNQGWKDSLNVYQYADGSLAKQPIKDVFVNATFWAALSYGVDIFQNIDAVFTEELLATAKKLKKLFNSRRNGFLMRDEVTGLYFYAQALDRYDKQLRQTAADVGMCLWAYHDDECIIEKEYMPGVISRLLAHDMFNSQAGIRNYCLGTKFGGGTRYHGSADTYWPFVSALITAGLAHFNYTKEAQFVASALLKGVSHFESCIELFVEDDQGFRPWQHPTLQEQSAVDQSWTAAGMYYATSYLSHHK